MDRDPGVAWGDALTWNPWEAPTNEANSELENQAHLLKDYNHKTHVPAFHLLKQKDSWRCPKV